LRVAPLVPEAIRAHQEKLVAKLREALGAADEDRIRQEIAVFGVKVDVAEELSRLSLHLTEVDRILEGGGAAGKKLDFLMQELNREANTLGSKSVSKELSDASLEMKLLIEQMREQVQNIE
ncbi:MAG: endoribonuclease YicC domain-containing protein, partial [Burkholderiales bacterium]